MSRFLRGSQGEALRAAKLLSFENRILLWGVSAVGSARHWQCRGQGFESPTLQILQQEPKRLFLCMFTLFAMKYKQNPNFSKIG